MTKKQTKKKTNKTRQTGTENVARDGNMLRLQFPSNVSQAIWGTRQKYKSLGLSDTPENMAKAQEIARIAQTDLFRDELDVTLEKYSPFIFEKTLQQAESTLEVFELCEKYVEEKVKPDLACGTQLIYKSYLGAIKTCSSADIIKDAIKIKDSIRKTRAASQTRLILDFLHRVVEWGKRNELMPKNAENPYKELKQDVSGKASYQKPKHIQELLGHKTDEDRRAYSPHEAVAIIEEFAHHGKTKGVYKDLVEFLFLTGCRTSEALGLRWIDVSDDCSEITFRHSYCRWSKELKDLKTARHGKTSRKFPSGEKLKLLLLRIRSQIKDFNPKDYVFNRNGSPINYTSFHAIWAGHKDNRGGVIKRLIKENKISTYLKPYSTRHSFITWQLAKGQTPANVAKLVGNTPEMIYQHYVSADENAKVVFEP
jgi:integrase